MTSTDTPSQCADAEPVADPDRVAGLTVGEWVAIDPRRTERWVRVVIAVVVDVVFRLRTYGAANVPDEGGFILCANHASFIDPFHQVRGQRRLIRYMTKAEVFKIPVVRWILRTGGCFPIRRGAGDTFAFDVARGLLRAGHPVFVYPEGTRYRKTAELGRARSGAARLALELGVPVLPAATWGNKPRKVRIGARHRWAWPKVTTVFGAPLDFSELEPTPENVAHVRDEIWREVHRLYEIAGELTQRRRRPRRYRVPERS